jgi:hypothetical protein
MKTKNFYCSICSTGFTRRGSGKRHNDTLHEGKAIIEIAIDYVIKRATGIYGPADAYSFRRNRIQGNSIRKAQENKTFDFRNSGKYVLRDHQNRTRTYEARDRYPSCPDTKTASSSGSSFLLERSFKVCEVLGLLKKHWPHSELQAMLGFASCLYINQNDELLDYMLNCLRHVDIIKSDHQTVTRTHLPLR